MKLFKVTDTAGRVWYLNRDWILRISKARKGTLINFALNADGSWTDDSLMGMTVKESVTEVKALLDGADMPMGRGR